MTTSPSDCHPKPRRMDQKSCRVESGTCHIDEISKKSRKTSQEMGRLPETQTTQSNDLKNNNTRLTAANKIYEREKKENNTRSTLSTTELFTTPRRHATYKISSINNITSSRKGTIDGKDPVLLAFIDTARSRDTQFTEVYEDMQRTACAVC